MDADAAELASVTSVIADTARRVAEVAGRRVDDTDDVVVTRLTEVERALETARRRLQSVVRELTS